MDTGESERIGPTPVQEAWMALRFGMFVHFNINTFYHIEAGTGEEDPARFDPTDFDPHQWAEVADSAGMKYAVITTRHHEGFSLWPSKQTDYNVMATPMRRDVLKEICEAFESRGIKIGLYYSLWDTHEPCYEDDAAYAEFMKGQLTELLTDYGPVIELWFDAGWEKGWWGWHDATRWHWRELYDLVKSLQPECLVLCNPGKMNGGELALSPVDLNCIERVHKMVGDQLYIPDTRPIRRMVHGNDYRYLPIETCDSIHPRWFYSPEDNPHPPDTIIDWLKISWGRGGNLLLNVPPTDRGLIQDKDAHVLAEVGRRLKEKSF